jgi:hypothetical protein
MFKLNLIFYLRVLSLASLVLFINRTYDSIVAYQNFVEINIDWKITFSRLSLIINSVFLGLLILTNLYLFKIKNFDKD